MMASAIAAAERCREVRRAARAWESAGFLGHEARQAIDQRYPDDRVRLPIGLRVLAFVLTCIAILGCFGFTLRIGEGGGERAITIQAAVFAVLCALSTELQRNRFRRADAGAELATALLTLLFAGIALVLGFGITHTHQWIALGLLAAVGVGLAARWGSGTLGLFAAILVFDWLAQFSAGRYLWILGALVSIGPLLVGGRQPALAPTHRLGCWLAAGVAVVALYIAVNLASWDHGWVENLQLEANSAGPPLGLVLRPVIVMATALLPLVLLVAGLRRREPMLVMTGLACLAASIATFHHYQPVLPLAYLLLLAGLVMLVAALGIRRWLRAAPGGERIGWTADALFTDESQTAVVRDAMSIVAFTPASRADCPSERTGGGRFGGGGAVGKY